MKYLKWEWEFEILFNIYRWVSTHNCLRTQVLYETHIIPMTDVMTHNTYHHYLFNHTYLFKLSIFILQWSPKGKGKPLPKQVTILWRTITIYSNSLENNWNHKLENCFWNGSHSVTHPNVEIVSHVLNLKIHGIKLVWYFFGENIQKI